MEATAKTEPWRPDLSQVRLEDLAGTYGQVAKHIGLPAALALIATRGGTGLLVPSCIRPNAPLDKIIGSAACAQLCSAYKGQQINIPTARTACLEARNREVRAARAEGAPVSELAARFGLAERRIQQIITGDRA
jgi:hypothetical protein